MAKKKEVQQERFDNHLFTDANEAAVANDVWQEGQAPPENQPIGNFQVDIASAILERSQSSERLQIHYELVILSGNHKDIKMDKYDGLETAIQTRISQAQLQALGIKVKGLTIHMLPAILLKLVHQKAAVKCKQSGQFYNINFVKLIVGTPQSVASRNDSQGPKTKKTTKRQSRSAKAF